MIYKKLDFSPPIRLRPCVQIIDNKKLISIPPLHKIGIKIANKEEDLMYFYVFNGWKEVRIPGTILQAEWMESRLQGKG
jgi:hypothetical protein